MQLPTRLSRFIAKRGVAATAAAVMMVGGGVAIAQNGGDAEEPPGHEVARTAIDGSAAFSIEGFCEDHASEASFCAGLAEDEEATEEDVTTEENDEIELLDEGDEADEADEADEVDEGEATSDGVDTENAQAFSAWVREIPSEWGCIRGQLVSAAAQAGPLTSDFETFLEEHGLEDEQGMFDSAREAAEALGLEGRCVDVVLEREEPEDNGEEPGDIDTAETSNGGPPEDAGPPAHAGPPEEGVSATQGTGPPEGKGPPGRSGN